MQLQRWVFLLVCPTRLDQDCWGWHCNHALGVGKHGIGRNANPFSTSRIETPFLCPSFLMPISDFLVTCAREQMDINWRASFHRLITAMSPKIQVTNAMHRHLCSGNSQCGIAMWNIAYFIKENVHVWLLYLDDRQWDSVPLLPALASKKELSLKDTNNNFVSLFSLAGRKSSTVVYETISFLRTSFTISRQPQ